jgi:Flp pilus assembly protein TadB
MMKIDPNKISHWLERKADAYDEWFEHWAKNQRKRVLKDHRTLEIAILGCAILIILGLITHLGVPALRSVCVLAGVIVYVKIWQFVMIALHPDEESDK